MTVATRLRVPSLALVRDGFNRADNTTLGNADSGQAWTVAAVPSPPDGTQSVFGISSKQASVTAKNGTSRDFAYVDPGLADCRVTATLLSVSTAGLGVRLATGGSGQQNGFINNASTLFRSDAGSLTGIITFSSSFVNGDVMTIVCKGSVLTVYRNGASVGTATDATYATQTRHGLRATNPTLSVGLWDDFQVAA